MAIKKLIKHVITTLVSTYILVFSLSKAVEKGYINYQMAGVILLSLGVFSFLKWKKSLRLDDIYVPIQFIKD